MYYSIYLWYKYCWCKIVDDDGHDHDGKPYHEVVDSPLTTQRMRNPLPKS